MGGIVQESRRRVLGEEHPDTLESMNELACVQATCRDSDLRDGMKAVENANAACELTDWKKAWYVATLAAAYAEVGDFDSAIKWQRKAIDLLPEEEKEVRTDYEERLKLYQSGKPYRENP